jgi:hypothetical protein
MKNLKDLLAEKGKIEKSGKPDKNPEPALEFADCCEKCDWGSSFNADSIFGRCDKWNKKVNRINICKDFDK